MYVVTKENKDWKGREFSKGKTITTPGGDNPYTAAWVVGYKYAEVLPFLNTNHPCDAWHCQPAGTTYDDNLHVIANNLTPIKKIEIVKPILQQYQKFALACAISTCQSPQFLSYANDWLNGTNKSTKDAAKLYQILEHYDENGRDIAYCAIAGICGTPNQPQSQEPLEVYCAAAGWRLWSNSEHKTDLIPFVRFALKN